MKSTASVKRKLASALAILGLVVAGMGIATPALAAASLGLTMTAVGDTVTSGDTTTYQVAWSCSSVSESCDAGTISVPVPTLTPYSEVATTYVAGTPSTGGYSAAPAVTGGIISWKMSDIVAAGSSGTMTFTLKVPNMASPNGATIVPVATYTANGISATASATKTVVSDTDLFTDKRRVSTATPGLDVPVAYQVTTGHKSGINPNTGRHGNSPAIGTWAVNNVVTVDRLPAGAEFVSATGGGVYDSAAHTVTWPAWSENGGFVIPPTYQITIRYPSSVFTTASIVTNTASATANPHLAPNQTVESSDDVTHGFVAASARGAVTKGGSLDRPNGGVRGGSAGWAINIANTGTVPLNMDFTDALPCVWSSPTDGSQDCATPAVRNVALLLTGGIANNPYTFDYVTNLGNSGSVTLVAGPATTVLPQQSSTEWVTSIRVRGSIPGGDRVVVRVDGTVTTDLPQDSSDATYRNPAVPKGTRVFLENCLSGTLTNSVTNAVVQDIRDVCGYVAVDPDRPVIRVEKTMTDNVQGPTGVMGVNISLTTHQSRVNWSPVLTDLLPADLRFVPGSFDTSSLNAAAKLALPDSALQVEVIDDHNGTGRQLVRVSWPGTAGLAPTTFYGSVKFQVSVVPGAPVGQRTNVLHAFDSEYASTGCISNVSVTDTQGLADDSQRVGCASPATYSIVSTPAVGGTKWVRGSEDAEFKAAPGVGAVLPGEAATYRLDVSNLGNALLSHVVAYEILPYVGDTGVGPTAGAARGSQWQTLLSGSVGTDVPAEIMYSLSSNPCRGEVIAVGGDMASGPVDCVDDWSTSLPANPEDARAIRVDFGDREFAPGEVQSVTIPVTTPDDAEGIAWNSFAVSANEASTGNAVLPVEPNVVGLRTSPSLSIDKSASTATVIQGDEITWTITVTNDGTGLAEGVIVIDEIQDGMEFVSAEATNGSYDPADSTWTLSSGIPVGASAVLELVTRVLDDTPLEKVCNIATVSVTGSQNSVESPEVCADVLHPAFTVSKASDAASVLPGGVVTYTVTVTNTGDAAYTDESPASFADDLSGVLDDAAFNDDASAGATVSGSTLSWEGALEVGESIDVTYSVTVDDPITGDFLLANSVVPTGPGGSCDPDAECATETPVGSFRVVKSTTATEVVPGAVVDYTVTVTNIGQVAYTDEDPASFSDDLSAVLDDATYNADAASSTGAGVSYTAPTLAWAGALGVGETATITYSVTVNDPATGDRQLDNTVVTPPGSGSNCVEGSTDPACTANVPAASYTVSKAASSGMVVAGDVVTYTVTVTNTGQVAYTDESPASFNDDLTRVLDDASYNDDVSTGGKVSGNTLTWSGPLAVGETLQVVYTVTVNDPVEGDFNLRNVVAPSAPGGECTEGGCVTDTPVSGYSVKKSADVTSVVLGGIVVYTVSVTNTGQAAYAEDAPASITDDLSGVLDDATYNDDASAGATVTGSTLAWSGPLAVGETVTVTYSVTVNNTATGDGVLHNTVLSDGPGGSCASDQDCVTETPVASYRVTKDVSTTSAHVGDRVTFTITVTNTGQVDYTDADPASFTDDLSSLLKVGTFNNDATNGAQYEHPVLSWSGGLGVGESVTVTYSVTATSVGEMPNVVVTPDEAAANCSATSTDPDCTTTTQIVPAGLAITGGAAWTLGGVAGLFLLALGVLLASRRRSDHAPVTVES